MTGIPSIKRVTRIKPASVLTETQGPSPILIAFIAGSLVAVLFCALVGYKCYFQDIFAARKRERRQDEDSALQSTWSDTSGGYSIEHTSVELPNFMMKLMKRSNIRITKQICKGGFGFVYEGVYDRKVVAVKRIIIPEDRKTKLRWMAMFSTYLTFLFHSQ